MENVNPIELYNSQAKVEAVEHYDNKKGILQLAAEAVDWAIMTHIRRIGMHADCIWGVSDQLPDGFAKPGWYVEVSIPRWSLTGGLKDDVIGVGLLQGNTLKYTPIGGEELEITSDGYVYELANDPEKDRAVCDVFFGLAVLCENRRRKIK